MSTRQAYSSGPYSKCRSHSTLSGTWTRKKIAGASASCSAGPALQLALAPAIFFLVQVPLSVLWLRHFEYGPLEYAWRVLTYGRMRFKPVTAAAG